LQGKSIITLFYENSTRTRLSSLYEHYKQFVQSVISLNDIVFFLSITAMFLLLVMIVIEKRRWSQGDK